MDSITPESPRVVSSEYQIPSNRTPDFRSHDHPLRLPHTMTGHATPSPRRNRTVILTSRKPRPNDPRASSISLPNSTPQAIKVSPKRKEGKAQLDHHNLDTTETQTLSRLTVPSRNQGSSDLLKSENDIPTSRCRGQLLGLLKPHQLGHPNLSSITPILRRGQWVVREVLRVVG